MTTYDDHDLSRARDKTNERYGRWTVTSFADTHVTPGGQSVPRWNCRCSCGTTRVVRGADLASGKSRSCGCLQVETASSALLDLSGQRYGRLLAISHLPGEGAWRCRCDCGAVVAVQTARLRAGNTASCGCLRAGPTSFRHKDRVTYNSAHHRIRRRAGSARNQTCVDCDGRASDWSYVGGDPDELSERINGSLLAYSLNQSLYVPRCRSCHKSYDLGRRAA